MSNLIAKLAAGTVFGAALTASGVYSPWIIISQMKLEDFHMLQAFLTASAISAILMVAARKMGVAQCAPPSRSTLGWFHGHAMPIDGNILGGVLLGLGMTLTGACPGTVLVQVASGIRSGYFAMVGGVLGGAVYVQLAPYLSIPTVPAEERKQILTVFQHFNIEESQALLIYEGLCAGMVLLAAALTVSAENIMVNPIVGGVLIGCGQATSLVLTGNAVGVSTAYGQLIQLIQWTLKRSRSDTQDEVEEPIPALTSIAFAIGIMSGAAILKQAYPAAIPGGEISIPALRAILGGGLMVFGARLAGGCTSGHGISGMSTLSISSFITVASIFAGGMTLAAILG
ncbi:hypothetical protein LSUB1_G000907 [Lachnellula subtilissima]|uniref:Sulphur transport domain-containing protein n=1 Tax=Lachnellula subtilissima TaxID=602034 RepID=A0A8H8RXQ1_9HELO|nr:hypothetical protein LSUB1_G000907 [Lachnellula subtilissima]